MSIFDDAEGKLQRYFSDGWWDIYDGAPAKCDSILTVSDIVLSVALNSKLDTRTKIWYVWKNRDGIEFALSKVPNDISLVSDNIPWQELNDVFGKFLTTKHAKESVTTKILHKKRPYLIPIFDKVVKEYFRTRIDPGLYKKLGAPFLGSVKI
jgi:hypothetical protein